MVEKIANSKIYHVQNYTKKMLISNPAMRFGDVEDIDRNLCASVSS
jgi:hypothetical protein